MFWMEKTCFAVLSGILFFDQFRVFYSGLKKHVLDGKNMFCGVVWDPVFLCRKDYDHECVEEHVLDGKNMFAVLSGILFFLCHV
jgi:hypothetical protein